jgi:hypothetical protein
MELINLVYIIDNTLSTKSETRELNQYKDLEILQVYHCNLFNIQDALISEISHVCHHSSHMFPLPFYMNAKSCSFSLFYA